MYPWSVFAIAMVRFFVFEKGSHEAATLNHVKSAGIAVRPRTTTRLITLLRARRRSAL